MKANRMPRLFFLAVAVAAAAALMLGCASIAVSDHLMQQHTARVLNLPYDTFTVSERVNDGVRSTYRVETKGGRRYSCRLTGTISIDGRVVSDPVCSETDAAQARNALTPAQ